MSTGEYYNLNIKMIEVEDVFVDMEELKKGLGQLTDDYIRCNGYPFSLSIEDNGDFGDGTYLIINSNHLGKSVFGFRLQDIKTTPLIDLLEVIRKRHCAEEEKTNDKS